MDFIFDVISMVVISSLIALMIFHPGSPYNIARKKHKHIEKKNTFQGILKLYILHGSLGTKYYDMGFYTMSTACYDYVKTLGGSIHSAYTANGVLQEQNKEYLPYS